MEGNRTVLANFLSRNSMINVLVRFPNVRDCLWSLIWFSRVKNIEYKAKTTWSVQKAARSVWKATEVYKRQRKCTEGNRSVQKATEKTLYNSTLVDFYANKSSGKVRFLYVWRRTLFEKSLLDKGETTNRFEMIKKQHFGQISTVSNIIFWQRLVQGKNDPSGTHISLQ